MTFLTEAEKQAVVTNCDHVAKLKFSATLRDLAQRATKAFNTSLTYATARRLK